MLFLKLPEHLILLLLITGRLSCLLLPLVIHHLFHHPPRLSVQIAELAVLGRDLGSVDFGRGGDNVLPPLHLVGLGDLDGELFAAGDGLEGPGGIVGEDGVREVALRMEVSLRSWASGAEGR